jgi:hypothetical protein
MSHCSAPAKQLGEILFGELQLHHTIGATVKTATLPALRVSPALRASAERALRPHETLSKLMESSLESFIAHRQAEDDFIARGLRGGQLAKEQNLYIPADTVIAKLEQKLSAAKLRSLTSTATTPRKRSSTRVTGK